MMETYRQSYFLGNDVILYFGILIFLEYVVLILQGKPTPRLNDTLTSISLGLFQECFRIAMRGFEMYLYYHLHEHYRLIDLSEQSAWLGLLLFLLMDFGYYWIHRANHEINILWAHHQVHHSSDDFSMSVGVRHGIFNNWLSWILYSPLALFIPPSQFIFHLQISVLYQFWIHTETIENLGPVMEGIFNTPEHHRIHHGGHGCNKYLLDKNYGGVLIIWDRIFGTYQERTKEEKTVYSLIFPPTTFNLIRIQSYYYAPLWNRLKHFDNWTNRMEALFKGPSWTPGSPWTGWEHLKMSITERPKFEVLIPRWKKYYIAIHFLFLLTNFQSTFSNGNAEVFLISYIFLGYVITTLIVFSCLLDGRSAWICFVEFGRCIIFLLVPFSCFYDGIFRELQQIVFYISAGMWGYLALEYSYKCYLNSEYMC